MPKETGERKTKLPVGDDAANPQGKRQITLWHDGEHLGCLQTTQKAVGKSNTNAASDLEVAALNLKGWPAKAWLNVLLNLSGVKDEAFCLADYRSLRVRRAPTKGCALADEIYLRNFESCLIDKRKKKLTPSCEWTSSSQGVTIWFYQILELRIRFKMKPKRWPEKARHCWRHLISLYKLQGAKNRGAGQLEALKRQTRWQTDSRDGYFSTPAGEGRNYDFCQDWSML